MSILWSLGWWRAGRGAGRRPKLSSEESSTGGRVGTGHDPHAGRLGMHLLAPTPFRTPARIRFHNTGYPTTTGRFPQRRL